ncbi:transposase [Thiohalocapsa halophila]|uniref:Transposase n=1 Tax=Thiohalocapsa halophila TaxID=69359 RepID=A0ABS1CQE3_9GAMM|nr:transposase [Thiohalocapsa halophila]MBK1633581.1 transposase [Thiohalocapsa halophila]
MPRPAQPPHSQDLRKGRVSEPGRIYHVRTSTASRRRFFSDLYLGREVVRALRFQHATGNVESLAFVVMPDHLHWLIQLGDGMALDALMHAVKGFSAQRVNKCLRRSGPVWQAGYFDRAIRADEDVPAIARYIVANPLRAGLCAHIGDYPLWDAVWV